MDGRELHTADDRGKEEGDSEEDGTADKEDDEDEEDVRGRNRADDLLGVELVFGPNGGTISFQGCCDGTRWWLS